MKMKILARSLSTASLTVAACGLSLASAQASVPPPPYYPYDIGLEAGTTGPGVFGDWRFSNHLGVRAGVDYLPYNRSGTVSDVDYTGKLRLLSEPLTLNLYPSKTSSFHLALGVALNQNQLTGTASGPPNQTVNLDGMSFPYSDVGTLNIRIKQLAVDPYAAIRGNFFHFDKAHHWALGGELGGFYTGQPQVSLTRSGGVSSATAEGMQIDTALNNELQKAKHYARDFQFWPVLKLQVNYAF
jgi:hypothetical protein